jgi:hypothetical protein
MNDWVKSIAHIKIRWFMMADFIVDEMLRYPPDKEIGNQAK